MYFSTEDELIGYYDNERRKVKATLTKKIQEVIDALTHKVLIPRGAERLLDELDQSYEQALGDITMKERDDRLALEIREQEKVIREQSRVIAEIDRKEYLKAEKAKMLALQAKEIARHRLASVLETQIETEGTTYPRRSIKL